MHPLSVVIITCNEERNIRACIASARTVSDDIVVVDAKSTDGTVANATAEGARVFSIDWQGYGFSRNFGAGRCRHDWVLALDADERVTLSLALSLKNLKLDDPRCQYRFRRINFFGDQEIRWGTLGFEKVTRLYNRLEGSWDGTLVHECLSATGPALKHIDGCLLHFGLKDLQDYQLKAELYARMSAQKYAAQGKRLTLLKRFGSPLFNGLKSYIFLFGFLEGRQGWLMARTIAWYSWRKYFYLHELSHEDNRTQRVAGLRTNSYAGK